MDSTHARKTIKPLRPPPVPVRRILWLALFVVPLWPAADAQIQPELVPGLPLTFAYLKPGDGPRPIEGYLRVSFPPDADCDQPMTIHLSVVEKPDFATANLNVSNVTIVPNQVKPEHTFDFNLSLSVRADAPALEPALLRVRASSTPCGNLAARSSTAQTQLTVQFRGKLDLKLEGTTPEAWTVLIKSRSNGPSRVTPQLLVPTRDQTINQPDLLFGALGAADALQERVVALPRSSLPNDVRILALFRIQYDGTADPDAIPTGYDSIVLQEASSSSTADKGRALLVWTGGSLAAVGLAIGTILLIRRRRPR